MAIVCRWARERSKPVGDGHNRGGQVAAWVVKCLMYVGVKEVTVYVLSTHNITSRSKEELEHIYDQFRDLVRTTLQKQYASSCLSRSPSLTTDCVLDLLRKQN